MSEPPEPLEALAGRAANVRAVLADIDDTISTGGRITARAYAALERLQSAGFVVVPVTGRPAGWCDHIARMWPVDAVVGENGAFSMRYDRTARKLIVHHADAAANSATPAQRAARTGALRAIGEHILREVPGSAWASDQAYRIADIAIDFREDVPPLPLAQVDRIVSLMHEQGLTARVSSIHVNGWFGRYDKLGMSRTLLREAFGIDVDSDREAVVFIGDSPNDGPMFEFFPLSVGVANIADWGDRLETPPRYVTRHRSGDGFVELADLLIGLRSSETAT